MKTNLTHIPFDETEVFRTQMKPLLEKLKTIADNSKISFQATTQYMQRDAGDATMEAGFHRIAVFHGAEYTQPCLVAASHCATDPEKAAMAMVAQAIIGTGKPPRLDGRMEMMEDGTDSELDATKDTVESLLGHVSAAKPDATPGSDNS